MNFAIVIHKDADSDYGVTVPDLPGCFTAGATLDEALALARDAIELHLEGLVEAREPLPAPQPIETHQRNRDYAGGFWAIVPVDPSDLRMRATRVTLSLPERVLDVLDEHARRHGETRSGVVVQAVATFFGRGGDLALRKAKPGRKHKPILQADAAPRTGAKRRKGPKR